MKSIPPLNLSLKEIAYLDQEAAAQIDRYRSVVRRADPALSPGNEIQCAIVLTLQGIVSAGQAQILALSVPAALKVQHVLATAEGMATVVGASVSGLPPAARLVTSLSLTDALSLGLAAPFPFPVDAQGREPA